VIDFKAQVVDTFSKFTIAEENINDKVDKYRNYLIAENLVLRIVESDYSLPLRRNVKFKKSESTFDCIIEGNDLIIGVEIKYFYHIDEKHFETVSLHLRRRLHTFQRISREYFPKKQRKFILYIVHNSGIGNFSDKLKSLFANENCLDVEIKFLEFGYLLDKFGFDE
jgi:hypothetical protein